MKIKGEEVKSPCGIRGNFGMTVSGHDLRIVAECINYNAEILEKCINEIDELEQKLSEVKKVARQKQVFGCWIPVSEGYPENDNYVLVSIENFSNPMIARYVEDEEGGAFYPGDEEKSLVSEGLFVNAWMFIPEPYRC